MTSSELLFYRKLLNTGVITADEAKEHLKFKGSTKDMSNKTFYLDSFITKSAQTDTGELKIAGYANTSIKDRTDEIIIPAAWAKGVDKYRTNPILLFQHKADRPIGRVT